MIWWPTIAIFALIGIFNRICYTGTRGAASQTSNSDNSYLDALASEAMRRFALHEKW